MNILEPLSETQRWHLMGAAAKRAAEEAGYQLTKMPGKGLSQVYSVKKDGVTKVACIRTTRDRWIAFPPLEGGKKWKTLDGVELVIVATVDQKDEPQNVQVYIFPADEVRKRFDTAYAARKAQGNIVRDNFGMWVGLDTDHRGGVYTYGSGIAEKYKRIASYPIQDLAVVQAQQGPGSDEEAAEPDMAPNTEIETAAPNNPKTIAEVMAWARGQVAAIAGVNVEAVKLDLKVEY
jgi:hypothetical protein